MINRDTGLAVQCYTFFGFLWCPGFRALHSHTQFGVSFTPVSKAFNSRCMSGSIRRDSKRIVAYLLLRYRYAFPFKVSAGKANDKSKRLPVPFLVIGGIRFSPFFPVTPKKDKTCFWQRINTILLFISWLPLVS